LVSVFILAFFGRFQWQWVYGLLLFSFLISLTTNAPAYISTTLLILLALPWVFLPLGKVLTAIKNWKFQLSLFFPEECAAELGALHQRLKVNGKSTWFIRLRMIQEILELLVAIYIQIKIEDLWLPQKSNTETIDD
jgi:hypothetical protein